MREPVLSLPKDRTMSRTVRRTRIAIGLILIVLIGFYVRNQTTNEITLINDSDNPVEFDLTSITQTQPVIGIEADNDNWEPSPVVANQTVAPHSTVRIPFEIRRNALLNVRHSIVWEDRHTTSLKRLPRWGNRITISEKKGQAINPGTSQLRSWIDAYRDRLPMLNKWLR